MKKLGTIFLGAVLVAVVGFAAAVLSQSRAKAHIGATLAVTDAGNWQTIQRGIEFRRIALERSQPSYTVEVDLLRFDSQLVAPRILYASELSLKAATVKVFAEKTGAVAAINANYFDTNGRPLAYLKTLTKQFNPGVSRHGLYTGVFGVRDAAPFVVHRDQFQPALVSEALQSGPLLLLRGEPVEIMPGLGRFARRSAIGVDKDGQVVIAATDAVIGGLSFAELQELFSASKWQIQTLDLLNLDGGGSAQLYVKSGKFEEWLAGTSEVPVAIGFFPRKN